MNSDEDSTVSWSQVSSSVAGTFMVFSLGGGGFFVELDTQFFEGLTEGEFSVISKTEDPREDRDYPCAYCKAEVRVSTLVPVSNGKGQPNAAWVCPGCQDTAQAMVDANRQAYLSADSEPEESAPQDHSG